MTDIVKFIKCMKCILIYCHELRKIINYKLFSLNINGHFYSPIFVFERFKLIVSNAIYVIDYKILLPPQNSNSL